MFGIHVHKGAKSTDLVNDVEKALAANWRCCQIYTHGPLSYNQNKFDFERMKLMALSMPMYVHATHFSKPWKGKAAAIEHIREQRRVASKIGALGLVVHLPKDTTDVVADIMPQIAARDSSLCPIILEMPAMRAADGITYESAAKLNALCDKLIVKCGNSIDWGLCIDTAHLWAGSVSMKHYAETVAYFAELKYPGLVKLFHLNGNKLPIGGNKDIHIIVGTAEDQIWRGVAYADSGLKAIFEFCRLHCIPIILEINRGEEHEVQAVNMQLTKWFKELE